MSHSTSLRLRDFRAVFQLLGELRDHRHDPAAWQDHLIHGMCGLFHAAQGAFVSFDRFEPTGDVVLGHIAATPWLNPKALIAWADAMGPFEWRDDPLVDRTTRMPGVALSLLREDIMPDPEWDSPANPHHDLARMADIGSHLIMIHRLPKRHDHAGPTFGATLHRTDADPRFSARERNVMRLLNAELWRANRAPPQGPAASPATTLTPRQREVLARLLEGDSEKEVARRLKISEFTANDHVKAIYRKLGVNTRAELLALMLRRPR